MTAVQERTDGLNRLIRGELSAVETYRQALDKMKEGPDVNELHALLVEHRGAVQTLREHVIDRDGEPETNSGAWGTWAQFVEGTAKVFGATAALKALKAGEEHGIGAYETFLKDDDAEQACKDLVRAELLPKTRQHIASLDRLIARQ